MRWPLMTCGTLERLRHVVADPDYRKPHDADRVECVLHTDGAVVERVIVGHVDDVDAAAFNAVNDNAGDRKWKFLPYTARRVR